MYVLKRVQQSILSKLYNKTLKLNFLVLIDSNMVQTLIIYQREIKLNNSKTKLFIKCLKYAQKIQKNKETTLFIFDKFVISVNYYLV